MSEDLINDPEWLELIAGFKQHFWESRVPGFKQALADIETHPMPAWPGALKSAVHGLAGVAALVDMESVGNLARDIEQRWDAGEQESVLRRDLARLAELLSDIPDQ